MRRISSIISLLFVCMFAGAQTYFFGPQGMLAEYESAPDSVVTIPLYRTPMPAQNIGALSGVFSVSPTRKVRFSRGNLQYETTTGTWRFASNQYDTVGGDVSKQYVDVFGYGTSGWAGSGATAYQPLSTSVNSLDYTAQYAGATMNSLTGYLEQRDWGKYNPILNGGNQAGLWRCLTFNEMDHLTGYRWEPFAYALVNGVLGIVLLPDNWNDALNPNEFKVHPAFKRDRNWKQTCGLSEEEIAEILAEYGNDTLKAGTQSGRLYIGYDPDYHQGDETSRVLVERYYDEHGNPYYHPLEDYNVTPEEWLQYEALGCVFLPFVTSRNNPDNTSRTSSPSTYYEEKYCIYWTSYEGYAKKLLYRTPMESRPNPITTVGGNPVPSYVGGCVRLVQDY